MYVHVCFRFYFVSLGKIIFKDTSLYSFLGTQRNKYEKLPIKLLPIDSKTTVDLVRVVLDRCDDVNYGNNSTSTDTLRKIKLAAFQCLHTWVNYTVESKAWVSLVDMMAGGLLVSLERQASMVSGSNALPAEFYSLLLQVCVFCMCCRLCWLCLSMMLSRFGSIVHTLILSFFSPLELWST